MTDIRRGNHTKHMNALCGENARFLKFTADGDKLTTGIQTNKETILLGMHKINKPVLVILSITRHRQNPLEEFGFLLCFGT
jgi:hypothetical protein